MYITDIQAGANSLQAKIVDANGDEVAVSSEVNFTYQLAGDAIMSGFEVLPGTTLKQGQKATFVYHADGAKSVELTLVPSDGTDSQKIPLDNVDASTWKKEYLMDKAGTFLINASMTANGNTSEYKSISTVTVIDTKSVQQVKYFIDNVDKTKLNLSWTYLGTYTDAETPYFMLQYGTTKDNVAAATGIIVSGASYVETGLDLTQQHYIQITPIDQSGKQIGEPSDVILIEPTKGSAPVCKVEGVRVVSKKIADKYYLTWNKVDGADRYIIYRSDSPIAKEAGIIGMQKVGETVESKFEYPYDPKAKQDQYAYYAVVAVCSDGSALQVDGTQKVKV